MHAADGDVAAEPLRRGHMAGQGPKPDFGQSKCPDCDTVMKPVSLPKGKVTTAKELECPKCGRRLAPTSR